MATAPWYTYPTDSPGGGYGQIIDPVCEGGKLCNYLKPDTNIAIPAGVPITALLPGTITDVSSRGANDAGLSVTEKLNVPLNSLAKYMSFNYLGQANVVPGENIAQGQEIGVAGSPTGINFALALGSDPVWGSGSGFSQNAVGNPLLNPMQLLGGSSPGVTNSTLSYTGSGPSSSVLQQMGTDIAYLADPNFWARFGVILLGGILILIGIWKLMK
jgi:hypothetical protein